jgi:hypothetical protein
MMEAVRTSETSAYSSQTTQRYIPEDSYLREKLGRICVKDLNQ